MKRFKSGISLVINTKNEQLNIKACISSARSLVNEVIVVDMKSSDETRKIAKKLGAKVFSFKDYGFVEPARDFAQSRATYEWVLLLDADERIGDKLKNKLLSISKSNKYQVVNIPRKNIIFGKWIKHTQWWPDFQYRFYKKSAVKWPKRIHKEPTVTGKILKLAAKNSNAILHYNYKRIDQFIERTARYTRFERNVSKIKRLTASKLINFYKGEFDGRYFVHKGHKDGLHGYFLSKLMEYYRFLEVLRFWEHKKYTDIVNPIELYKLEKKDSKWSLSPSLERYLNHKSGDLSNTLELMVNSKFFKIWRMYCNIRDKIFHNSK